MTEQYRPVKNDAVSTSVPVPLPRRLLAELLGTALLVAVVVGSGIAAETLSPGDVGLQLLENSMATVFGLAVLILWLAPVSGAHFNPVVSVADWFLGRGVPPERITPRAAVEMLRLAADLEDSAWTGSRELDAVAVEGLEQSGLDVLDSLKHHRELAPLLVHLNGLGVDLEAHDDTDDTLDEAAS